jgi:carbamoyltransferase
MKVLGINAFLHDSSVALVNRDQIVAAVEEERFNRIKKTNKFPHQSFAWLQEQFGDVLKDVQTIAIPWNKENIKTNRTVIEFLLDYMMQLTYPETKIFREKTDTVLGYLQINPEHQNEITKKVVSDFLNLNVIETLGCKELADADILYIPHHFAHAATGYYLSQFRDALVLQLDAFGDDCSTSVFYGNGPALTLAHKKCFDKTCKTINSLGIMYSLVTYALGFKPLFDEYKLMGLAAYGKHSQYYSELRDTCYFDENCYMNCDIQTLLDKIKNNTLPTRRHEALNSSHMDFAYAIQKLTEESILHLCRHWSEILNTKNICLTGGVALNCVVAGKIIQEGFKLFIPPIADDTGIALGAAITATHLHKDTITRDHLNMNHSFYGPCYNPGYTMGVIQKNSLKYEYLGDPYSDAAQEIASGKIIGWFDGASEIGPRALGNRSILADPRDSDMRRNLNRIIKEREDFRPFAIAILDEDAPNYFSTSQLSPFMNIAVTANDIAKKYMPAAVHVDGTTRIQTLNPKNGSLYKIVQAFHRITNVPAVINTSFNQKEPIVLTPQHAIDCFLRCKMDYLYFGHYKILKDRENKNDI